MLLGVNIDHVATLRNARGELEPNVLEAAAVCLNAGARGITAHLREDRRHIQDFDVFMIKNELNCRLNLEMAATYEMKKIALDLMPAACCIVPEKREELTTEGGLDVVSQKLKLAEYVNVRVPNIKESTKLKIPRIKGIFFILFPCKTP